MSETRRALVIGNSAGVGAPLAEMLLAKGWHVTGLDPEPFGPSSDDFQHVSCAVTDPEYRTTLQGLAPCQLVVFCAVTWDVPTVQELERGLPCPDSRALGVNVMGLCTTVETMLPGMLGRREGHIIGLTSQLDGVVTPDGGGAHASIPAMSQYLECKGLKTRDQGVCFTNFRAGPIWPKNRWKPWPPFVRTPKQVAKRIMSTLWRKPLRVTYPRTLSPLVWLLRGTTRLNTWFS